MYLLFPSVRRRRGSVFVLFVSFCSSFVALLARAALFVYMCVCMCVFTFALFFFLLLHTDAESERTCCLCCVVFITNDSYPAFDLPVMFLLLLSIIGLAHAACSCTGCTCNGGTCPRSIPAGLLFGSALTVSSTCSSTEDTVWNYNFQTTDGSGFNLFVVDAANLAKYQAGQPFSKFTAGSATSVTCFDIGTPTEFVAGGPTTLIVQCTNSVFSCPTNFRATFSCVSTTTTTQAGQATTTTHAGQTTTPAGGGQTFPPGQQLDIATVFSDAACTQPLFQAQVPAAALLCLNVACTGSALTGFYSVRCGVPPVAPLSGPTM
jgi:hypothetical protein